MTGQGISRAQRLRYQRDFQALRENGASRAHPLLVMRAMPNSLAHTRFGFVVSKRTAPLSVTRNRVRRRLREAVRALAFQDGWDVLLIARRGSADAPFDALQSATTSLARRLRLLAPDACSGDDGGASRDA
ncbi:MAG: ribonuclease P protein component [Chloroflexota bacterium]|nr:ribonuclease P protein component [Chloroflexota bacterium]MDE2885511.1 ribonuclease P protein component [Chloroflexota bacterium]